MVAAVACGGSDSPVESDRGAGPAAARITDPIPPPLPTSDVVRPLGLLAAQDLADRDLELRPLPAQLLNASGELTVVEREALWTEFLTDTRVEFDRGRIEILLCEGGHGTSIRSPIFFELVGEPLEWDVHRSPGSGGNEVVLKLTPFDPNLAADLLFAEVFNTPSYTINADVEEGEFVLRLNARGVSFATAPDPALVVHDPSCRSQLPRQATP